MDENRKNITSVGFTGDLSFSGYFTGCENDDSLLDDGVKSFLDGNDYNVINFESPVTPCRITKKRRLAHRCGPEALQFVKRNIKNPILSFANNHMMDFGYIGVIDSMDAASEAEIPFVGIGLNIDEACRYVILGDEVKVGVLAVEYKKYLIATNHYGGPLHESKKDYIKNAIKALKPQVDYVVLVYHGGDEFLHAPMPFIRKQLKGYLDWGCDIVVAHHPHVVQGYEVLGNKAIFYSLGNFVFDTDYQRIMDDTEYGMLLRIEFAKDGFTFSGLPTFIQRENHKVLTGDDLRYFTDIGQCDYKKFWSTEAYRQLDVKQRAKDLKEFEQAERLEKTETERVRVEQLQMAAELKASAADRSDEEISDAKDAAMTDPDEAETKRKLTFRSFAKGAYKKLVVKHQENCRSIVRNIGRARTKIFYRK